MRQRPGRLDALAHLGLHQRELPVCRRGDHDPAAGLDFGELLARREHGALELGALIAVTRAQRVELALGGGRVAFEHQRLASAALQTAAQLGQVGLLGQQFVTRHITLLEQALVAALRILGPIDAQRQLLRLARHLFAFGTQRGHAAAHLFSLELLGTGGAAQVSFERTPAGFDLGRHAALEVERIGPHAVTRQHEQDLTLADRLAITHLRLDHHAGLGRGDANQPLAGKQLAADGGSARVAALADQQHQRQRHAQCHGGDPARRRAGNQRDVAVLLRAAGFECLVPKQRRAHIVGAVAGHWSGIVARR